MPSPLLPLIVDRVRAHGPITVAEFVETALYHPQHGYYTSARQRSGRSGDFYTSVDLGPLFGELLAVQLFEMWRLLGAPPQVDLVEAAAGNGRLSRDIFEAAGAIDRAFLAALRLRLVERSPQARAAQAVVLGPHAGRLASSSGDIPTRVNGFIIANELLDALPPHVVVMRDEGLRELFVAEARGRLVTLEGPPSSPRIEEYLAKVGARLEAGFVAEVNLAAVDWVGAAARALDRGFLLLDRLRPRGGPALLRRACWRHADVASLARQRGARRGTRVAERAGRARPHVARGSDGGAPGGRRRRPHDARPRRSDVLPARPRPRGVAGPAGEHPASELRRRLAMKTLMLPGGMGSTHKVMIFGRGVGAPGLRGTRLGGRLT